MPTTGKLRKFIALTVHRFDIQGVPFSLNILAIFPDLGESKIQKYASRTSAMNGKPGPLLRFLFLFAADRCERSKVEMVFNILEQHVNV